MARIFSIDRTRQDKFALESHQKACTAIKTGLFKSEIIGVNVDGFLVDTDEGPRSDTTLEALLALKPAFKAGGSITAGNSRK